MLRCAIDVRRWSIRLALFGFWKNEPPMRLEARLLHSRRTARVLEALERWELCYGLKNNPEMVMVGCRADKWPAGLALRLQEAGYALQWIDAARPLLEGVHFLRSLQESPLFLRATVMAHWPSVCEAKGQDAGVLEMQYRWLRGRLMELEADMFAEGSTICPGHLLATCPDCEFHSVSVPVDLPWLGEDDVEPAEQNLPAEP
jgi:hypothetical protein